MQLAAVAETHAHNDYVSGGLELARSARVPYLVPCEAEVSYERTRVCGEDVWSGRHDRPLAKRRP